MANKKPIPKTQQEISKSVGHEVETHVRSNDLSVRNTQYRPMNVGLEDIDNAVFYYFNNVIKPIIKQNGENIVVPVVYGNQERWKSYKKDGYYRDKNGAIMLPIIALTRTNISKDRTVTNKLDANKPNLYTTVSKSYHKGNPYSNFNILNNRIPGETFTVSVVPSYVTIEYECLIQTYYIDQLNKIIEAVEYASDAYWGDPEKFKFRAFIDRFSTTTEIDAEKERFAKSTFTLRLRGYIIPETLQRDMQAVKMVNSKSKFTITTETVI